MDVTTITMEPEAAEAKLKAYKDALAARHSKSVEQEWEAAANAYAQLAKGTPLINPIDAIREAGWRPDARPKLAIARADQKRVRWSESDPRWWNREKQYWQGSYTPMLWHFSTGSGRGRSIDVPNVMTPPPTDPHSGIAMVPMVPPDVLPPRGCDLSKHFILWEVEDWAAASPIDPILLKPIGGDLYAVIAEWNLTELERAIIAGTRR